MGAASAMRSIWDEGTPEEVVRRFEKGFEACQQQDFRSGHGQFLLAMEAANGALYREVIFYGDISGLLSGQFNTWDSRYAAANEALGVARRNTEWLCFLYAIVLDDAMGIRLNLNAAHQQLYEDTGRMNPASDWAGAAWLAGKVVLAFAGQTRARFQTLSESIMSQMLGNLSSIAAGNPAHERFPETLLAIEELADSMADEPTVAREAVALYQALARIPAENWRLTDGDSIERHQEHIKVQLALLGRSASGIALPSATTAEVASGSGCLGVAILILMPLIAIAVGSRGSLP